MKYKDLVKGTNLDIREQASILSEKQTPHVKANSKKPKTNKPPKKGNTSPHPYRGKMVGEEMSDDVYDEDFDSTIERARWYGQNLYQQGIDIDKVVQRVGAKFGLDSFTKEILKMEILDPEFGALGEGSDHSDPTTFITDPADLRAYKQLRRQEKFYIERYRKAKDDIKKHMLSKMIDKVGKEMWEITSKYATDEALGEGQNLTENLSFWRAGGVDEDLAKYVLKNYSYNHDAKWEDVKRPKASEVNNGSLYTNGNAIIYKTQRRNQYVRIEKNQEGKVTEKTSDNISTAFKGLTGPWKKLHKSDWGGGRRETEGGRGVGPEDTLGGNEPETGWLDYMNKNLWPRIKPKLDNMVDEIFAGLRKLPKDKDEYGNYTPARGHFGGYRKDSMRERAVILANAVEDIADRGFTKDNMQEFIRSAGKAGYMGFDIERNFNEMMKTQKGRAQFARYVLDSAKHCLERVRQMHWEASGSAEIERRLTGEGMDEGKQHGNSKMYDKCWDGYEKVPGKKRGEKGSCRKVSEDLNITGDRVTDVINGIDSYKLRKWAKNVLPPEEELQLRRALGRVRYFNNTKEGDIISKLTAEQQRILNKAVDGYNNSMSKHQRQLQSRSASLDEDLKVYTGHRLQEMILGYLKEFIQGDPPEEDLKTLMHVIGYDLEIEPGTEKMRSAIIRRAE
jgi:hypothetical protein